MFSGGLGRTIFRLTSVGRRPLGFDQHGPHDVGASPLFDGQAIDIEGDVDQAKSLWETSTHALMLLLNRKKVMNLHQLRSGVEQLSERQYANLGYYDKWALSIYAHLTAAGLVDAVELDRFLGPAPASSLSPQLSVGARVRVKREDVLATRWRRPHLRVPGYIFGHVGEIVDYCGVFEDPEAAALTAAVQRTAAAQQPPPVQPLYRVRFRHADIIDGAQPSRDTVDVELTENWLTSVDDSQHCWHAHAQHFVHGHGHGCNDHDDHDHRHQHDDHDHHHQHDDRATVEQLAVDKEIAPSVYQRLSEALIKLLQAKNIITAGELAQIIELLENADRGPLGGARLVARAWADPAFRALLLSDGSAAAEQLGVMARSPGNPIIKCVENTDGVHNLIVCTLCSCYPVLLLGRSPSWYKSRAYRARAVREPRTLLAEFGTDVGGRQVRVHDSTAELRYLVLPQRPAGSDGMSEDQLATIVSRDAMIGVRLI